MTKAQMTELTTKIRKERAQTSAPTLVAAIKRIVSSVPVGYCGYDQEGELWTWNDRIGKMEQDRFTVSHKGIKWNFARWIDEPTFTRYVANALTKGGVLTIGNYAALLDGTWAGLKKEEVVSLGYQLEWPQPSMRTEPRQIQEEMKTEPEHTYEDVRDRLLLLADTELPEKDSLESGNGGAELTPA